MAEENVDLRFLAEQGKQILAELAEARAEQRAMREEFAGVRSDISDRGYVISAVRMICLRRSTRRNKTTACG